MGTLVGSCIQPTHPRGPWHVWDAGLDGDIALPEVPAASLSHCCYLCFYLKGQASPSGHPGQLLVVP